jgi:hypothetical protein
MIHWLKRLFGLQEGPPRVTLLEQGNSQELANTSPHSANNSNMRSTGSDRYFDLLGAFSAAVKEQKYKAAIQLARESLREIPLFVTEWKNSYGSFDISSIPVLENGGTIMAVIGDREGIAEIRRTVESIPDLHGWLPTIEAHERDVVLVDAILKAIREHPGILQNEIKNAINAQEGGRPATLISWLEKARIICRQKSKKTYQLTLANGDYADIPSKPNRRPLASHRTDRQSPPLKEIDLNALPYVPLPRAPKIWETSAASKNAIHAAKDWFDIQNATNWWLKNIEALPINERPDPAFRKMYYVDSGIFMIDDLGNAESAEGSPAAIQKYSRDGQLVYQRNLEFDIYRIGINPLGHGFIAMSKECFLHAYDDHLKPLFETALIEAPEIKKAMQRLEVEEAELKNHIRCIAISKDNTRYLFTFVDEVWCITRDGNPLWGAKLPEKEGWTRFYSPSAQIGNEAQISEALQFMNISLPASPDDVKRKYRSLAKEWHPDLNPGDPAATKRMQRLTAAAELLTGVDLLKLRDMEDLRYGKHLSTSECQAGIGVSVSLVLSGTTAADWIYAANFAGLTHRAFVAGYSGRVIVLDENGEALRAYDIGAVPRRIVDTGDFLYILTDTRLYILMEDKLCALIDVHDEGELVVGQTGFGLLGNKRFRWFNVTPEGTVVETRQHRAVISGIPYWWKP